MSSWVTTTSIRLQAIVIGLLGLALMLLGFGTLLRRLDVEVSGTIVQTVTTCDPANPAHCTSIYQIATAAGIVTHQTSMSSNMLPAGLPVGATLAKERWRLGYLLNGQQVDDFPLLPPLLIGGVGAALLCASVAIFIRPALLPPWLQRAAMRSRGWR